MPGHVLVIGNFDGVHKGHQALMQQARQGNDTLTVLSFDPHPRELFRPTDTPFRLTDSFIKEEKLREYGADTIVHWPFDWQLAKLSAHDFLDRIVTELTPHVIAVGSDFAFGHQRTGTIETLHQDGRFQVISLPLLGADGAISSSRIRGALAEGDIAQANQLLGWNWLIRGTVQQGEKRGRQLGFPTANLPFGHTMPPKFGVYAVKIHTVNKAVLHGVANIGVRPSFASVGVLLEVHLFDFDGDIYGQELRVEPVQFIRPEHVFTGLDALKQQIAQDCIAAKAILG